MIVKRWMMMANGAKEMAKWQMGFAFVWQWPSI